MQIAQHPAHRRDPTVMFRRQACAALLRIHPHAPELEDPKCPSVLRQPLLPVEHRPLVAQLHGQSAQEHDRRKQDDGQK